MKRKSPRSDWVLWTPDSNAHETLSYRLTFVRSEVTATDSNSLMSDGRVHIVYKYVEGIGRLKQKSQRPRPPALRGLFDVMSLPLRGSFAEIANEIAFFGVLPSFRHLSIDLIMIDGTITAFHVTSYSKQFMADEIGWKYFQEALVFLHCLVSWLPLFHSRQLNLGQASKFFEQNLFWAFEMQRFAKKDLNWKQISIGRVPT